MAAGVGKGGGAASVAAAVVVEGLVVVELSEIFRH